MHGPSTFAYESPAESLGKMTEEDIDELLIAEQTHVTILHGPRAVVPVADPARCEITSLSVRTLHSTPTSGTLELSFGVTLIIPPEHLVTEDGEPTPPNHSTVREAAQAAREQQANGGTTTAQDVVEATERPDNATVTSYSSGGADEPDSSPSSPNLTITREGRAGIRWSGVSSRRTPHPRTTTGGTTAPTASPQPRMRRTTA